ncbi:MAG: hypothetical protein GC154_03520 [bacterium]|nr:hypothetical protein [bacterium]
MNAIASLLWKARWPLAFAAAIALAVLLRLPRLEDGHVDEVHTVGRSLQMLYTGDFSPHFYQYPTGGLYYCLGADILALAKISREVTQGNQLQDISPLDKLKQDAPAPIKTFLFDGPQSDFFKAFLRQVRFYFMLMVPVQILILAYLGRKLNLLAPALAASLFLAFSSASRLESTYAAVNTPCGTFYLLVIAAAAWFVTRPAPRALWAWYAQLAALGLLCGFAVGFKYNAGVIFLVPMGYAWYAMRGIGSVKSRFEVWLGGTALSFAFLIAGFWTLTPYWLDDFAIFSRDVLQSIWHMQVGHADYNSFTPGLQMGYIVIRCVADQMAWTGIGLTLLGLGYLGWTGFFKEFERRGTFVTLGLTMASCAAFLVLMSKQSTFWSRNFCIIWPALFFGCASVWWYAAEQIAKRRGVRNVERFQWIALAVITVVCLLKANWLDIVLNPNREWWR